MKNIDNQEVSSSLNTFKNFINNNFLYIFLISLLIFPIYKLDRLEENIKSSTTYQESMIYGRTTGARESGRNRITSRGPAVTTQTRPNVYERNIILSKEKKKYEIIYYSMISLIVLLILFIYQKDNKFFDKLKLFIQEQKNNRNKKRTLAKESKAQTDWIKVFSEENKNSKKNEQDVEDKSFKYEAEDSDKLEHLFALGIINEEEYLKKKSSYVKPGKLDENNVLDDNEELNTLTLKFQKNTKLILQNKKTFVPYFSSPSPMSGTALDNLIDISKSIYVLICTLSDEKRKNKVKGSYRIDIPAYDWEAIKETVKNYANKTSNDKITLGLSIEAVCFNIFEFGRLSKSIGLKLVQYNMGEIKENDLDKWFEYDFITKKFEI